MSIAASARKPKAALSCEKPMAISLGEADAMIIAAQRNDVKPAHRPPTSILFFMAKPEK